VRGASVYKMATVRFLARDAFVRMNRRTIAMMFVRLSVPLSGTGVHCGSYGALYRGFKFMVG